MYVRFEDPRTREGLFSVARDFRHDSHCRLFRVSRRDRRPLSTAIDWLWRSTPEPPADAYEDWASRLPRTWFHAHACAHVRTALLIAQILRRYQVLLVSRASADPGTVLYSDDVQVVIRPHREPQRHPRPLGGTPVQLWTGDRSTIRK